MIILLFYLLASTSYITGTKPTINITQSSDPLASDDTIQKTHNLESVIIGKKTPWLRAILKYLCCCRQANNALPKFDTSPLKSPKIATTIVKRYTSDIHFIEICYASIYRKAQRLFAKEKHFSSEEILYIFENTRIIQLRIESLFNLFEKYNGSLPNPFGTNSTTEKERLVEIHKSLTQIYSGIELIFPDIAHQNHH